jgi:predicted regulator of Ras-like GTPase activity (Roadblock/LC7/MglB family)
MNHYTVPTAEGQTRLSEIAALPGVRHVAIIDSAGLCLIHSGHEPVSPTLLTDWTVLARAAFLANDDMGQRCGIGPCLEALQTHAEGGTLMRQMRGSMMIIVQHTLNAHVGSLRLQVREAAEQLPVAVEPKTGPYRKAAAMSMSDDPFSGNGWWSEKFPISESDSSDTSAATGPVEEAELVEAS